MAILDSGALEVLRSPAGHALTASGDALTCQATGRRYRIENGTPLLYDPEDIPAILHHDYVWFAGAFEFRRGRFRDLERSKLFAHYNRCRFANTEFMFTALAYDDPGQRRVLEIGVGDASLVARFGRAGFDAWAVDYFPFEMELLRDTPGARFHTVAAPMSRLPFADGAFDLVYLHAALHHALPNREADFAWSDPRNMLDCLREVRRVLKPREAGGAFFLLGEGLYPEGIQPQDREFEVACQQDPEKVYESWYTLGEYEQAFREAGLFPNLFTHQEDLHFQALAYTREGAKKTLVTRADGVTEQGLGRLATLLAQRLGDDAPAVLPGWISLTVGPPPDSDPLARLLTPPRTADGPHIVATQVHRDLLPGVASLAAREGVPWFEAAEPGFLVYGPYCKLPPGRYLATLLLASEGREPAIKVDVTVRGVPVAELQLVEPWAGPRLVSVPFALPAGGRDVEVRVHLIGSAATQCVAAVGIHTLV